MILDSHHTAATVSASHHHSAARRSPAADSSSGRSSIVLPGSTADHQRCKFAADHIQQHLRTPPPRIVVARIEAAQPVTR